MASKNSCWSTIVQPGVPCAVKYPEGSILNITGLSLENDSKQPNQSGKITLCISVNKTKPVAIMSFIVGRYDSAVVNIILGKGEQAVLSTTGEKIPVKVSGCLLSYKPGASKSPTAAKTSATKAAAKPAAKKTTAAKPAVKKTAAPIKAAAAKKK
ncbi:hypothetical protein TRFO_07296 [Tritrichomonas foetus]|uniref:Nucleoplasmin-like domain-containing protein n=1 Tax=Tritrichomonas foetus TaxID=1144522 RepID=A0A1J4JX41_9EUKA|nr:hypothetical protein TRFO_07296 [Tritrichomonas foetus]|eukprot:OHT02100.1 hypothetical protein TRFO_07296 [Tritrichomonas foetus]